MDKAYFFTFTLLDCLNMSPILAGTIAAVTRTSGQLAQTAGLFLITVCCYTAVAYFIFGKADIVDKTGVDDDPGGACETLIECFIWSLYVGVREGDMEGAMVDAPGFDDPGAFRNRILYDVSFFIILGVLLFDVVTGIILDEFGAIREEVNDREDKLANETFISGITRDTIEEMEGNAVDFKLVNYRDQDKWNYLFFMIYLGNKAQTDCDGCESFVKKCIAEEDTQWVPQRTCISMEMAGLSDNEERSPEEIMEDQIVKLESLEKSVNAMMKKVEEDAAI